jgi:amidase
LAERFKRDFTLRPRLRAHDSPAWEEKNAMTTSPTRRRFLAATSTALALAAAPAWGAARKPPVARDDPFATLDATAQAELVRRRQASPKDLVEAAIRRIEAMNPLVNAVVTKTYDRARAQAAGPAGDGPMSNGPFAGVPFLIKDLISYQGVRNTSGSRALFGAIGQRSFPFIERIEQAGLIVLGLTNTPEFGLIDTTEPLLFGPSANPWNLGRSTGGSSGGSAAAVASGMVPFAHASDGGGSIRIPAANCGLFGLKISRGRAVPGRPPAPAGMPDISVNHCLSRSVRDSARFLSVTEQREGGPFAPVGFVADPGAKGLKIALIREGTNGQRAEAEIDQAVLGVARLCEGLGHRVEPARWPFDGDVFMKAFLDLWSSQAAGAVAAVSKAIGQPPGPALFEPWTLGLAAHGAKLSADQLTQAVGVVNRTAEAMERFFGQYDVMLSPVLRHPAKPLGAHDTRQPYDRLMALAIDNVAYTPVFNATGQPAMSLPLAWTRAGLPIGIQFGAGLGQEARLLGLAYQLEAARPWAGRWAPNSYPVLDS